MGPLTAAVRGLCARLAPLVSPELAAELHRIAGTTGGPLRIAVTGPPATGRTTLINSLRGWLPNGDVGLVELPAGSGPVFGVHGVLVVLPVHRAEDASAVAASYPDTPDVVDRAGYVAVLGKSDLRGAGAGVAASVLDQVCRVAGTVGLFAEAASQGRLRSADLAALRLLLAQRRTDPRSVQVMLADVELFHSLPGPVAAVDRRRLIDVLDLVGVEIALDLIEGTAGCVLDDLRAELAGRSGLAELARTIEEVFLRHGDVLASSAGLAALRRLSHRASAADRALLRDGVDAVLAAPAGYRVPLLPALAAASRGAAALPESLIAEIGDLVAADPDRRLDHVARSAAIRRAGWWSELAASAVAPARARIATEVALSYLVLAGCGR